MRDPDIRGQAQAWENPVPETADPHAQLGDWFVFAPWAHPVWNWYRLSLIHLRPMPGLPGAKLQFPDATHEFQIVAMNPDHDPPPLDERVEGHPWLKPPNVAHQVQVPTDAQACAMLKLMVETICAGRLSPDSDFRTAWNGLLDRWALQRRRAN